MNKVKKTFICAVKSALDGVKRDGFLSLDENERKELFRLCERQMLFSMVFFGLKYSLPDNQMPQIYEKKYFQYLKRLLEQEHYSEKIFEALDKQKIYYMPLKGYVLRGLYPDGTMRPSCDVDFLFDEDRKRETYEIIENLDFKLYDKGIINVEYYLAPYVYIEPHTALAVNEPAKSFFKSVWEKIRAAAKEQNVLDKARESGDSVDKSSDKNCAHTEKNNYRLEMSKEDFYIYFLYHSSVHFLSGGNGVRTIADVYVINKNFSAMDEKYLSDKLKVLGLEKYRQQLEKLARVWFEDQPEDADSEAIGEYLLSGGVYGDKEKGDVMRNVTAQTRGIVQMKFLIARLFPPFVYMKYKYPILNKIPVLLPFVYIIRIISAVIFRKNNVARDYASLKNMNRRDIEFLCKIKTITDL